MDLTLDSRGKARKNEYRLSFLSTHAYSWPWGSGPAWMGGPWSWPWTCGMIWGANCCGGGTNCCTGICCTGWPPYLPQRR